MGIFNRNRGTQDQNKPLTTNKDREGFMPYSGDIEMKPELTKSPQITTFQPSKFDEMDEIANHLIKFKQIKLNLASMDSKERIRSLDFISGIMYAYHGRVEVIGHNMYLFLI